MCIFLCMSNWCLPGKLFEFNLKPRTEEGWRKWFLTWSPVYRPCIFLLLFLSRSFFIFFFFFFFFFFLQRKEIQTACRWLRVHFKVLCLNFCEGVFTSSAQYNNLFHWFVFLCFFSAEFIFSFQSERKWERESHKSWQWWYWHEAITLKHTHTHTHTHARARSHHNCYYTFYWHTWTPEIRKIEGKINASVDLAIAYAGKSAKLKTPKNYNSKSRVNGTSLWSTFQ